MRHGHGLRKLNRTSSHRLAMLQNMMNSLIEHEAIKTTVPKAKELRRVIEPMITLAKEDSVANRRLAFNRLREQPRAADVGREADTGLGHGELRGFGDDAVRRVAGDADTATHRDAVGNRHNRLRVLSDEVVHDVLGAEELGRLGELARNNRFAQRAHVAAGAQTTRVSRVNDDRLHVGVVTPLVEGTRNREDHVERQSIERARTIKRNSPESAARRHQNVLVSEVRIGHESQATSQRWRDFWCQRDKRGQFPRG